MLFACLATEKGGKYFPVAKSAQSGSAAYLIGGYIVDSMFSFNGRADNEKGGGFHQNDVRWDPTPPFSDAKVRLLRDNFKGVELVLVDEMSMLSATNTFRIYTTLQKIANNSLPWGGFHIILCGDLFQLPSIPANLSLYMPFYKNQALKNVRVWLNGFSRYIFLDEVVRQSDKNFAAALGVLRDSPSSTVNECVQASRVFRENPHFLPEKFTFSLALAYVNTR